MQVIVSHAGADFDAYASMVAAQRLYPRAKLVALGRPAPAVREFLSLHQGHFPVLNSKQVERSEISQLIMVDTSNPQRLGEYRLLAQQSGVEVHIYDHHPPTAESVQGEVTCIERLGAAVTVLLKRIPPETAFSVPEATLYLIAIYEETGNFTYSSTTAEDLQQAARLLAQGAKLSLLRRVLQQPLSQALQQLRQQLLERAQRLKLQGVQVLLLSGEVPEYVDEMASLISLIIESEGVDVVLAAVTMGSRTYLVGRSRHPRHTLVPAFTAMGGGGHPCAASATLAACDPQEALRQMLEHLPLNAEVECVAQHMNPQVDFLEAGLSVQEAAQWLQKRGRTATVVVQQGSVVGMLARSDLDKALAHDLGHAPADSVMTKPVLSVSPEESLEKAQQLLVQHNVGRLPVIKDGQLVGIISRTDLLRQLYTTGRTVVGESTPSPLLQLPAHLLEMLKQAGGVAANCGVEVYAVGGFVRDMLLGRLDGQTWDLDLSLEGSVDGFLEELAALWGASIHRHPRFETATLVRPDGQKVDVARTRQEHYVRPAALPEVSSSNLKQDLFRRDFTINALAVRLTDGHFGEMVDFFGGQADLAGQTLRVLHNHSFIDDPTRIFRAVRLEQRLGFHLGRTSEHLLRSAVGEGLVPKAGPDRIREELIRGLSESCAIAFLERLQKLKVLASLHPQLSLERADVARLQATEKALAQLDGLLFGLERWRVLLRAWLMKLDAPTAARLLDHYHLKILTGPDLSRILWRLNRVELPPSQIYALLQPLHAEELVLLWALSLDTKLDSARLQERLLLFLEKLRGAKPLLSGREILASGVEKGPAVGEWKARLLAAQLDLGWQSEQEAELWLKHQLSS
jgi:tRNA nucleotidyltransferase (CCA-adding enzyme)